MPQYPYIFETKISTVSNPSELQGVILGQGSSRIFILSVSRQQLKIYDYRYKMNNMIPEM
ncbi:MAG TPA: hypothetical protein VE223_02940 [Nitrososphaeraceae archaeon]|nr:hypothetical protein [Nitrososphaeraceae archaeon]